MRNLVYFIASTLDGYIAAPDGTFDFFAVGEDYLQVLVSDYPDLLPAHVRQALGITAEPARFDAVISGYRTYAVGPRDGFPSPYSQLRQYVVSSRLTEPPHPDLTVINSDPLTAVRELKQQPGKDIYLCGGGKLASALISEIDELIIKQSPIVLGDGIKLFDGPIEPRSWQLVDERLLASGTRFGTYRPA